MEDVEGCRKGPPTYEIPFPRLYWLHQICEAHNDLLFQVDHTGSSRNSRTSCRVPLRASNHVVEHWLCNVTRTKSSICSVLFIPIDSRTTRRGNTSVTTLLQSCWTLRNLLQNCGCTLLICTHPEHHLCVLCLPHRHTGLMRASHNLHTPIQQEDVEGMRVSADAVSLEEPRRTGVNLMIDTRSSD